MKQKIHNQKDWAKFALGYLCLAELAFSEITEKKHDIEYFDITNIYIPGIFNLKHGIEVLIKALSIEFLSKATLDQSDYSHDIDEIFSKLRREVKESRIKAAIEKFEQTHPQDKGRLSGKSIFDEFEKIVLKYQNLSVLQERIGTDYIIQDIDNTALRYPTNNLNIQVNYEQLSKKFQQEDVYRSLIDAIKLQKILFQLSLLLAVEKQ